MCLNKMHPLPLLNLSRTIRPYLREQYLGLNTNEVAKNEIYTGQPFSLFREYLNRARVGLSQLMRYRFKKGGGAIC